MLAVPINRHGMRGIDLAAMHAIEHLERVNNGAAGEIIDFQPPPAMSLTRLR